MKTILQIEDNVGNRMLVERVLSAHNYRLIQAETGEIGIQKAVEETPDLVLIDIGLPDVDGHTVLTMLKQIPHLHDVPLVAVTAWPAEMALDMCERYGYDGCITKPISVRNFPTLIAGFLAAADHTANPD